MAVATEGRYGRAYREKTTELEALRESLPILEARQRDAVEAHQLNNPGTASFAPGSPSRQALDRVREAERKVSLLVTEVEVLRDLALKEARAAQAIEFERAGKAADALRRRELVEVRAMGAAYEALVAAFGRYEAIAGSAGEMVQLRHGTRSHPDLAAEWERTTRNAIEPRFKNVPNVLERLQAVGFNELGARDWLPGGQVFGIRQDEDNRLVAIVPDLRDQGPVAA